MNNQILNQILLATHITCWEENNLQIKVLDNKSNKYTSNRSPYIGAYKLIIWSLTVATGFKDKNSLHLAELESFTKWC